MTGEFGWPEVPDAIRYACLVQGARFYDRRQNISGPVTSEKVDDVAYGYGSSTDLDSDVAASLADYQLRWYVA